MRKKGWAGAAIWYNRIAQMNGEVTGAVMNPPQMSKWPLVMENVLVSKESENNNIDPDDIFQPFLADMVGRRRVA
jgi:hypothetical protein